MSQIIFTLSLGNESALDMQSLRQALAPYAETEAPAAKSFDWESFVAIAKGAGEVAASAKLIYDLAHTIYTHTRGKRAKLSAPDKPDLDLEATLSDQEVLEWLIMQ